MQKSLVTLPHPTFFLLLAALCFAVPQTAFSKTTSRLLFSKNNPPSVVINFELPEVVFEAGFTGKTTLRVEGLTPTAEPGLPAVYGTGVSVLAPKGYSPSLKIIAVEERQQEDTVLEPFRRRARCGGNVLKTELISKFYESENIYPKENIRLEKVGKLQDADLYRVAIHPIQMDMGKRSVRLMSHAKIQVDFSPVDFNDAKGITLSPNVFRLLHSSTANAAVLPRTISNGTAERMLIIAPDDYVAALKDFVTWKAIRGIKAQVVPRSVAGTTAEAVKRYIQGAYDDLDRRPTYLLLVGNGQTMPPFFRSTFFGEAASDYPFSLLSGSDPIPDLMYGRLVADNLSDVQVQVRRWIEYERDMSEASSWLPFATTIASQERGISESDEAYSLAIQQQLRTHNYQGIDNFLQRDQTATPENITQSLRSGRSWVTYFGHGTGTSWRSTNESFDINSLENLQNAGKLPVVFDIACSNGGFTNFSPCFGKKWVTQTAAGQNSGAVAYYGASVDTTWDPPAVMAIGIAKRHFEKPVMALGGMTLAGQMYLIEQMGITDEVIDNMEWFNLFGDPSLLLRTAKPQVPHVQIEAADSDGFMQVSVANSDGQPIIGATATLRPLQGELTYAVGRSDNQGRLTLDRTNAPRPLGASYLTITGYNLQTLQMRIE